MEDYEKALIKLKGSIRTAINNSGLSLSLVEDVLDSIKLEVVQPQLNTMRTDAVNKLIEEENLKKEEEVTDGISEDSVDK